jgi:hypothetical protein
VLTGEQAQASDLRQQVRDFLAGHDAEASDPARGQPLTAEPGPGREG